MAKDISQQSNKQLIKDLSSLDQNADIVYWIRDREMTTQIYQGSNFAKIWERDPELVLKYPMLWLDFLEPDGKESYMQQFQARHDQGYKDPEQNFAIYRIVTPSDAKKSIIDHCILCIDHLSRQYIVGMAKQVNNDYWQEVYNENLCPWNDADIKLEQEYHSLLNKSYGLTKLEICEFDQPELQQFCANVIREKNYNFTAREFEALYYLCLGQTAKEVAKIMQISPRTVESFVEQIVNKTELPNKLKIISYFSRFIPKINLP